MLQLQRDSGFLQTNDCNLSDTFDSLAARSLIREIRDIFSSFTKIVLGASLSGQRLCCFFAMIPLIHGEGMCSQKRNKSGSTDNLSQHRKFKILSIHCMSSSNYKMSSLEQATLHKMLTIKAKIISQNQTFLQYNIANNTNTRHPDLTQHSK